MDRLCSSLRCQNGINNHIIWDTCRSDEYLLEKLAGIEVSINVTPNGLSYQGNSLHESFLSLV